MIVLCVLLSLLVLCACGAPVPRATFASADLQRFAVSLQGQSVGYMTMSVGQMGTDSLLVEQDMEWVIVLLGTERRVTMTSSARTGTDYDLGTLSMVMSDGSSEISVNAVRREGAVETTINTSGREISRSVEFEGDYLPAFMDLAAAGMQWSPGEERVYQTFDPSTGTILEATVTCQAMEDMDLLGDTVPAFRLEISQAGMRTWSGCTRARSYARRSRDWA